MTSILTTIKQMLGFEEDYTEFDVDIIVVINGALMTLTQIGVGPSSGFFITSAEATWTSFLGENTELEGVKTYIYLKVKSRFDSTLSASVLGAIKEDLAELEVRLNIQAETPISGLE